MDTKAPGLPIAPALLSLGDSDPLQAGCWGGPCVLRAAPGARLRIRAALCCPGRTRGADCLPGEQSALFSLCFFTFFHKEAVRPPNACLAGSVHAEGAPVSKLQNGASWASSGPHLWARNSGKLAAPPRPHSGGTLGVAPPACPCGLPHLHPESQALPGPLG